VTVPAPSTQYTIKDPKEPNVSHGKYREVLRAVPYCGVSIYHSDKDWIVSTCSSVLALL
jgi:hypothetical protein